MAFLPSLSGSNIQDTYQRVLHLDNLGKMYNGTGSTMPLEISGQSVHATGKLDVGSGVLGSTTHDLRVSTGGIHSKGIGYLTGIENPGNYTGGGRITLEGEDCSIKTTGTVSGSSVTADNIQANDISATTAYAQIGKFDHIITRHETIEFQDASSNKLGDLKFDQNNGLRINNAQGSRFKMELQYLVVREANISEGFTVLDNGTVSASNDIHCQEIFFNKLTGGTF